MRFLICAVFCAVAGLVSAQNSVDSPEVWKDHLINDLLPFWSDPAAAGTPPGSFAGNLCNDGSAPVAGTPPCVGVNSVRVRAPQQTLVSQSRQVFSYAVAFHMTGQKAYLDLAKAGLDYQFDTFLDDDTSLFNEVYDVNTGALSTVGDSQKQAYGLLGAGFVHYLTGDAELYARIAPIQQAITDTYRLSGSGGYKQHPLHTVPADAIAKHLDQLNSYQTLMASQAPVADKAALTAEALGTAQFLIDAFYDPATGLMRSKLSNPSGTLEYADFGHSVKSFWFVDQTAKLAGDDNLSAFAQNAAKTLFKLAYSEDAAAWRTNHTADGTPDDRAHWWGFAELNQYAASLAIEDPELRDILGKTQAFWLEHFVDPDNQGIWGFVDIATQDPNTAYSKHWEWKAGFHSYEHALINYLSASAMQDGMADLFFARDDLSDVTLAYGFDGDVSLSATLMDSIQQVSVSNLTFGAAPAPVPLPASMWLLAGALIGIRTTARRKS